MPFARPIMTVLVTLAATFMAIDSVAARQKAKPQPRLSGGAFNKKETERYCLAGDEAGLPRVLLIGDSISVAYTFPVRKALSGKANVHRVAANGGSTIRGLKYIDTWLGRGKWDVIHFNWGLHDMFSLNGRNGKPQAPLDEYEKNLGKLVQRLKQTGAKLIWCSTTPVPKGSPPPATNKDAIAYNAVAKKIMDANAIAIDDLYALALPKMEKIQRAPGDVHFSPEGSKLLAEQVAGSIMKAVKSLPPNKPVGQVKCVRKIDLRDFGGWVARFGQLDGDGIPDAVFVQTVKQQITCITAINLQGKILWQRGKADRGRRRISSDAAIQIYDFDGDGQDEVLIVEDKKLLILDGRSGRAEREAKMPGNDCLLIANFSGAKRPGDLLIKDRYKNIWAYDNDLKVRWKATVNSGHYAMNVDVDGDGRDELICGYTLFDDDGKVLWNRSELKSHNDAVDADDMDGDGKPEIAIACSGDSALLSADGKILWRKPHKHSQHAVIGAFAAGRPGKQVVFIDQIEAYSKTGGIVYCYQKDGKELWHTRPQGGLTIASTIDGWTGQPHQSFVLLYRRSCGPPVLLDGAGRQVAEFPFPPALEGKKWDQYFVQHFDALGDSREEVFVYSGDALWVYINAAAPPANLPKPKRRANPRVYNASFYVGWQ